MTNPDEIYPNPSFSIRFQRGSDSQGDQIPKGIGFPRGSDSQGDRIPKAIRSSVIYVIFNLISL
jgi:hypothetical protein